MSKIKKFINRITESHEIIEIVNDSSINNDEIYVLHKDYIAKLKYYVQKIRILSWENKNLKQKLKNAQNFIQSRIKPSILEGISKEKHTEIFPGFGE
jgi:hypothetical protein